jgi:hypothetical protein
VPKTITGLILALATSSDASHPASRRAHRWCGARHAVPRNRLCRLLIPAVIALCLPLPVSADTWAQGVDEAPETFINEVFAGRPPPPRVVWITRDLRERIKEILGHAPAALRVRYWGEDHRTAWVLEEIGKERPITVGLVVNNGHLQTVRVLAFRESRGGEVRYPFFTDQFKGAGLTGDDELDRSIDGISGATLSVRALKKLARLALFLHQQTPMADDAP